MRHSFALFLLIIVAWATPAAAQGQPLDLAAYERLLREARAAALRGDRLDVVQVAPALTEATSIVMPDGSLAQVDNSWLSTALAQPAPDLPKIAAQLGALIDALDVRSPPAPADATQQLKQILAQPPFTQAEPAREPGPIERFFEWLFDLLGQIFQPVAQMASGMPSNAISWLLMAVGGTFVLVVLGLWLRSLRHTLRPVRAAPAPAALAARDTADARAQAAALAQANDYRGAARMLALAALLWLDERRLLPYDPHQTNREHLHRLGARPLTRATLSPIIDTVDRVWYGAAPIDATGYAEVERQVEALQTQASDARSGPPAAQE